MAETGKKHVGTILNKQGLELRTVSWPSGHRKETTGTRRRILFFVHGHGAHLEFELLRIPEPGAEPTGPWS